MDAAAHGNLLKKRLVIFGCGYVGSALAEEAQARGLQVTALTRNHGRALALRAQGVEVVVAELAGVDWHAQIPDGAEWVVNCVSSGGGGVDNYRRSYVDGMRSILEWAKGAPVGTLVFTSSTSVYPQDGGVWVDETCSTKGATELPQVLVEAEELLRETSARAGSDASSVAAVCQRWFILRLAGIYGPGRHHLLDQMRRGETQIAGRGDHRLNLAHRDDIVAAIWAVLEAPASVANEVFNIADGNPATKAEISAWLAGCFGCASPSFSNEAVRGRRAVTPDRMISSAKLSARLGWSPRHPDFRHGYAALLAPDGPQAG